MSDKDIGKDGKKHLIATVPAILTGSAALVAALTTTYVSLRDGKSADPGKTDTAIVAPATAATPNAAAAVNNTPAAAGAVASAAQPATASVERPLVLSVERIAVHSDGTSGATNWRFAVEVDDEPRFAFEQERLTDEGGRNIAFPKDAATTLRLAQGKPAKIVVKGWKTSMFHAVSAQPDAQGEGRLDADGKPEAIQVSAPQSDLGSFTFYFTADAPSDSPGDAPGDAKAPAANDVVAGAH